MNKQFEVDTGKVYETFNNLTAKDKDNENIPWYTNNLNERALRKLANSGRSYEEKMKLEIAMLIG